MVFSLSSVPFFFNIIVRISNVTQGNVLAISFWSKGDTRFTSYVYDPVEGVVVRYTISDSAGRRYIAQHSFAVKPAHVLPGRCKRDLHNSTEFLLDATLS